METRCTRCALHVNALTTNIQGRGRETGGVLIVTSGPESQDDLTEILFSGPTGAALSSMLADAGFKPEDYRLTAAVRCIGTPQTEQIDACRPYLVEEIARVQPEAIIALGDVALRSLCRRQGVQQVRGRDIPLHPVLEYVCGVFPTYAPGYVLHLPQARNSVVVDLRRVRDRLKPEEPIVWKRRKLSTWITDGPIAVDIETSFFEDGKNTITQTAIALPDLPPHWGMPTYVSSEIPKIIMGSPIIGHNILAFDAPHLREQGAVLHGPIDDTLYLAYLDDESQPRGLEALSVKYLGVRGWKDGLHAPLGSDEFAAYNARDALYTLRLHAVLSSRLGPRKRTYDHIMRPAHAAFVAAEKHGIYINQAKAAEFDALYTDKAAVLLAQIQECSTIENPASNQQVATYFFGDKQHAADKAHLMAHTDPVAEMVLEYRHAKKMLATFIRPYAAAGRIHFPTNLTATDSGRVSARYHNLPRELKSLFGAPRGSVLLVLDYSAIEFRFAMWHAGVTDVLQHFMDDPHFDPHRWFAVHFYGIHADDVSKDQRQIAKSGNFGLLYKSSALGLADYAYKTSGTRMPIKTAYAVRAAWLQALPQIPTWWERVENDVRLRGYVESVFGRRRHFGNPKLLPKGGAWNDVVRAAVNHEIQSACTDIAQTGLILCHRAGLPVNLFQHDSIGFEFGSLHEAQEAEPLIRDLMTTQTISYLEQHFGVRITVPLTVEATYTQE